MLVPNIASHMVAYINTDVLLQADLDKILDITTALAAVISSDQVEDRDELNKMYIGVTAIARRTRRAKETRDAYLHEQVGTCELTSLQSNCKLA